VVNAKKHPATNSITIRLCYMSLLVVGACSTIFHSNVKYFAQIRMLHLSFTPKSNQNAYLVNGYTIMVNNVHHRPPSTISHHNNPKIKSSNKTNAKCARTVDQGSILLPTCTILYASFSITLRPIPRLLLALALSLTSMTLVSYHAIYHSQKIFGNVFLVLLTLIIARCTILVSRVSDREVKRDMRSLVLFGSGKSLNPMIEFAKRPLTGNSQYFS
jgi:hypothetical protein